MEKTSVKVSVIMPLYNCEKWMRRAIESVLSQDLKEIELILIDDGSTDGSFAVAQEYSSSDSRVTVIRQDNQGPGAARNSGMAAAIGEYIGFVDSDDYIEPNMYSSLFNYAKDCGAEIAMCGFDQITNDGSIMRSVNLEYRYYSRYSLRNIVMPCVIGNDRIGLCYVWNKIYSRSLIKKAKLQMDVNYRYGEDHFFNIFSFVNTSSFCCIKGIFYHYTYTNSNCLTSKQSSLFFSFYHNKFLRCKQICFDFELSAIQSTEIFVHESYDLISYLISTQHLTLDTINSVSEILKCVDLKESVFSKVPFERRIRLGMTSAYFLGPYLYVALRKVVLFFKSHIRSKDFSST